MTATDESRAHPAPAARPAGDGRTTGEPGPKQAQQAAPALATPSEYFVGGLVVLAIGVAIFLALGVPA